MPYRWLRVQRNSEMDLRRESASRMVTRLRTSRIKVPYWLQGRSASRLSRMHAEAGKITLLLLPNRPFNRVSSGDDNMTLHGHTWA